MADLSITAADVAAVEYHESYTLPDAGENVTPGQYVRMDSNGKVAKGNATTAGEVGVNRGIVVETLAEGVRYMTKGILDLGDALDSLAFGALVYVSDTDATLADAAGTVSQVVGEVVPGWGHTTADKLLAVDLT